MTALTHQQKRCLDAIKTLTVGGVAPSFEELRVHLGLRGRSAIQPLIAALIERGAIRHRRWKPRSLEVIQPDADPFSAVALEALSTDQLRLVMGRCKSLLKERRA